jgi:hypothetical protein
MQEPYQHQPNPPLHYPDRTPAPVHLSDGADSGASPPSAVKAPLSPVSPALSTASTAWTDANASPPTACAGPAASPPKALFQPVAVELSTPLLLAECFDDCDTESEAEITTGLHSPTDGMSGDGSVAWDDMDELMLSPEYAGLP